MDLLLSTLVSLGAIGFILGAGLAFASKKFAVAVNPLVEQIIEILPGANCGGCGYAGCAAYAESVVLKGASASLCAPGGNDVAHKLAKLLSLESVSTVRRVVYLACAGSREKARDKYLYEGLHDCQAAVLLGGGPKACEYGCMGFGTCVAVCKFDALRMGDHGLPMVDWKKCTACGACVRACPKKLFSLLPDTTTIYLGCSSHDRGKAVKDVCTVGCIGCGICAKVTENELITMVDNLPLVKYDASPNLILAHYKCPTKSYIDCMPKRPHMNIDSQCKGHGKCVEVCPVKDCITGEPGQEHSIDPRKCIGCGLCLGVCPEKAIHVVGAMGYIGLETLT